MQGLFVHGGGACVPGLTEKLAEWLELPTQLGTVQLPAGGAGVVNGPGSAALRVAVGLADYREQEAAA